MSTAFEQQPRVVPWGDIGARMDDWVRHVARPEAGQRRAAVVVALFHHHEEPSLMVIKRVARGTNPGQWALPGGKVEGSENAIEAGLRELREETGLRAGDNDVLGLLDDFVTLSGFVITPVVVAVADGQAARRDRREVHSLHPIALRNLVSPGVPRWRQMPFGRPLLQMPLRPGMVIHAPTGAILWQFAEVALLGRDTRVADLRQPEFTSR